MVPNTQVAKGESERTMSELQTIQDLYRYNSFVRKKYLRLIFSNKVPPSERYKSKGASFPSIVDIFVHVLDAYRWWFLFVYNDRMKDWKRLREQKQYTKEEVAKEEHKIDSHVIGFVSSLKSSDLQRRIKDQRRGRTLELRQMLLHMVEEELQHRGEMNALLWRHGIEPPVVGIQEWPGRRILDG